MNPNPVHTKTCRGVGVTQKIEMALTLPKVLVCVLPQVGRQGEGRALRAAALRAAGAKSPTHRPAARRPGPTTLAESPQLHTGSAAPRPHAPARRLCPGRPGAHGPGPQSLVLQAPSCRTAPGTREPPVPDSLAIKSDPDTERDEVLR